MPAVADPSTLLSACLTAILARQDANTNQSLSDLVAATYSALQSGDAPAAEALLAAVVGPALALEAALVRVQQAQAALGAAPDWHQDATPTMTSHEVQQWHAALAADLAARTDVLLRIEALLSALGEAA
jgi:hypothetical protein